MGNPNVGKSAVFSRLTGAHVIASNYPGTTVTFTEGRMRVGERACRVIDVPGTYTLEPTSRAEEVAVEMLKDDNIVVNVVDSTNLERNLNLTLQLLNRDVRMVVALNMWDEALEHGIKIDVERLAERLGVPVVSTCAISGEGMRELRDTLADARRAPAPLGDEDRWAAIGKIVDEVQQMEHRHPTIGEELSHATVHPVFGPIFAVLVLAVSFEVVRLVGEGLIAYVAEPIFEGLWQPAMQRLSAALGSGGFIHDLLVGELVDGHVSFGESFGVLTLSLIHISEPTRPY